jgi:hypothetical protein
VFPISTQNPYGLPDFAAVLRTIAHPWWESVFCTQKYIFRKCEHILFKTLSTQRNELTFLDNFRWMTMYCKANSSGVGSYILTGSNKKTDSDPLTKKNWNPDSDLGFCSQSGSIWQKSWPIQKQSLYLSYTVVLYGIRLQQPILIQLTKNPSQWEPSFIHVLLLHYTGWASSSQCWSNLQKFHANRSRPLYLSCCCIPVCNWPIMIQLTKIPANRRRPYIPVLLLQT